MKERKWIQYLNIWYSVLILQLNPDVNVFQRKFVNEVRRCESLERILRKPVFCLQFECALAGRETVCRGDVLQSAPMCDTATLG